jgi:hypothetical protein
MREWFGSAAFIALIFLQLSGAGLAVAWLQALLSRPSSDIGPRVKSGQRRLLRRWSACWVGMVCVWLAVVGLLSLL